MNRTAGVKRLKDTVSWPLHLLGSLFLRSLFHLGQGQMTAFFVKMRILFAAFILFLDGSKRGVLFS